LQAGRASWWLQQFNQLSDVTDIMFATLVLVTWGSSKTLTRLASAINSSLENLSLDNWHRLYKAVEDAVELTRHAGDRIVNFNIESLPEALSTRTVVLLAIRAKDQSRRKLYFQYLNGYAESDPLILKFCQDLALELLEFNQTNWRFVLEVIAQSYAKGAISERYAFQRFVRKAEGNPLPVDIAGEIAKHPEHYPGFLVAAAEAVCKDLVASKIIPVGEIARRDKWFET
jgi:hypothetical protein